MAWSRMSTGSQQVDYNLSQYQPYAQEDAQQYYQPYQQGYQTQEPPQSSEREYYTPERLQEDPYQSYDQPRAEYPQQLPPM